MVECVGVECVGCTLVVECVDVESVGFQGEDSTLRSFSTVHDSYSRSLGRASYNKSTSRKLPDQHRMPPIIDFASGTPLPPVPAHSLN